MTDSPFSPFETHIDRNSALKILKKSLAGADDGELFLERRRSEVISFDDGRLRTSSFDASEGFGLRAVQGEMVGYSHSTEISEKAMLRAMGTVRLAVQEPTRSFATAPSGTNRKLYSDHNPLNDAPFPAKIDLLKEMDAYARDLDPRVVQASATIAASHQEIVILRVDSADVSDSRPMVRMNISIIVASHRENSQSKRIAEIIESKLKIFDKLIKTAFIDLASSNLPFWSPEKKEGIGIWSDAWKNVSNTLANSSGFVLVVPECGGMAAPLDIFMTKFEYFNL